MSASMLPLVSSAARGAAAARCRSRSSREAFGEVGDRLRLAFLDELEVLRLQAGDRCALLVGDHHAEVDEIDAGAERLLRRRPPPLPR